MTGLCCLTSGSLAKHNVKVTVPEFGSQDFEQADGDVQPPVGAKTVAAGSTCH
jgi:hypothetical protein